MAASPLRSQLAAAARGLTLPGRRRPNGLPESELLTKVKDGTQHAANTMDRLLVEAREVGVPLESALGFARGTEYSIRVLWNAIPKDADLRCAWIREEAAVAALQVRQWAKCDPHQLDDAELEQIIALADEQRDATAEVANAARAELHHRAEARRGALRRLSA